MYRFVIITVALSTVAQAAQVDTLEDIGSVGSVVAQRVIGDITVNMAGSNDYQLHATKYYADYGEGLVFAGYQNQGNAPEEPDRVSLDWFITSDTPDVNDAEAGIGGNSHPIVFTFDKPVSIFGFTTIDLLENVSATDSWARLVVFDNNGTPIAEQRRDGTYGSAGVVLEWLVEHPGIVRAEFNGDVGIVGPHYGIDDLVVPEPATLTLLVLCGLTTVRRRRSPTR